MSRPFLTRVSLEHFALGAAMLIFAQAFIRFFAVGGSDLKDGDWRIEMVLGVFYVAIAAIGVLHFGPTVRATLRAPGLLVLMALAAASALWASLPGVTLRRAGAVAGASMFGVILASRLSFQDQLLLLRKVLRFATACCLALWALKLTTGMDFVTMGQSSNPMADGTDASALRGIFGHKNGLGAMMALAILVDWHLPVRGTLAKTIRIAWLCGYAALLYFANSATALVACAATLGILYTVKKFRHQYGLLFPLLSLGSVLGAAVLGLFRDEAMQVLGRSSDLTGRTDLWHWVIIMIMKQPWLGYGYSSFWRGGSDESAVIESHIGWSPIYAHNGYLELTLSLGLIGLLVFLYVIAKGLWRAVIRAKNAQELHDLWPLAFLVFFVLHNFGECTILLQNSLEWALCIAIIIRSHPAYAEDSQTQIAESEDAASSEAEPAFSPEPEYI